MSNICKYFVKEIKVSGLREFEPVTSILSFYSLNLFDTVRGSKVLLLFFVRFPKIISSFDLLLRAPPPKFCKYRY